MNSHVEELLRNENKWQEQFKKLRQISLECNLTEELKWGVPCYTFEKKNIVLIHGFNTYCALLFIKGALLKDEKRILITQTENVKSGRQIRFTTVEEIIALESTLKEYILEAIEVERSGMKVDFKKNEVLIFPDEFQYTLNELPALKLAFDTLTPGRQKAYNLYFSEPKQSKTRKARIEKCIQQILNRKGLKD